MNKKMSSILTLLTLAVFMAIAAPASAAFNTYTVGSDGSTTLQSTFGWDETPYLYMKLPNAGFNFSSSFWHPPSDPTPLTSDYFASEGPSSTGERWLSLASWGSVKEAGDWTIDSNVFYWKDGVTATDSTSFTVTPEPLAMTLFLLGGAPIAANIYRKHRRVKA